MEDHFVSIHFGADNRRQKLFQTLKTLINLIVYIYKLSQWSSDQALLLLVISSVMSLPGPGGHFHSPHPCGHNGHVHDNGD